MVHRGFEDKIVLHISRDSTAINARERPAREPDSTGNDGGNLQTELVLSAFDSVETPVAPVQKRQRTRTERTKLPTKAIDLVLYRMRQNVRKCELPKTVQKVVVKRRRGKGKGTRAKPNKQVEKAPKRLDYQGNRTLEQNLLDLPNKCNIGAKQNSKGNFSWWVGYKLHLDVADGDIPVSAILTSASVHDSQVAIPLMQMSTARLTYLYELEDSAYDAKGIDEYCRQLGHVPIIDPNRRNGLTREPSPTEQIRYRERSAVERVNSNLHDNFGGRWVRVRGPEKVKAHLMCGVIAITAIRVFRSLN